MYTINEHKRYYMKSLDRDHENLFEHLGKEGFLVICAWCREYKNHFNIMRYEPISKKNGVSHGICEDCEREHTEDIK